MRNFLSIIRDTFTNSKIWYIWGNHELRYERYLLTHAEKTKNLTEGYFLAKQTAEVFEGKIVDLS